MNKIFIFSIFLLNFLFVCVLLWIYTFKKQNKKRKKSEALAQSQDMLSHILNSIPQSIFWKDRNCVYMGCNDVFAKAAGLSNSEQIIGKTDFDLPWPSGEAESYQTDDRYVMENNLHKYNIIEPLQKSDGTRLWIDTTKIPLINTSGVVYGVLGVFEDITERKNTEDELKKYHENLEEIVEERTKKLQQEINERKRIEDELIKAKEAAEAANKAKSIFLANMSHELRTPLNAIIGFAQLMVRDPEFPMEYKDNMTIINRSGEYLLGLINDVLDLSKIEAGHLKLNETLFDLQAMLHTLNEMIGIRAENKTVDIIFKSSSDVPRFIKTDEQKLRQILINLLSNALKFTDKGSVTLHVKYETGRLFFNVEDTGIGISQKDIEQIFKTFIQTEDGLKKQEGTGLGLAISQKFAILLGGKIHVKSMAGKGSDFSFDIPIKSSDKPETKPAKNYRRIIGLAPGQPDYRILIVEDREENRILLRNLIKPFGFLVREAENGKEALDEFEKWEPHLIWMDLRMPVMNGYEATKKIKQTVKGQAATIIALTASVFEEAKTEIISAGCDDFLKKPFRINEIFEMMQKHLGVQYIYNEKNDENDENDERHIKFDSKVNNQDSYFQELIKLPSELLIQLESAIISLKMDSIHTVINKIRSNNSHILANKLELFAKSFNYDEILKLIQKGKRL